MAKQCIISGKGVMHKSWPFLTQQQKAADHIQSALLANSDTPDIPELEHKRGHLLFVYGSLKSGFPRHYLLKSEGAQFVAVATTNRLYSLFYDPKGEGERYPILLPQMGGSPAGWVVGQLWLVYPGTIIRLDQMERNGRLFQRIPMNVQIVTRPPDKNYQQFSCVDAWGYMGVLNTWTGPVHSKSIVPIERTQLFSSTDRMAFVNFKKEHLYAPYVEPESSK